MTNDQLREFVERSISRQCINFDDLNLLRRELMPEGPASREEADVLIALDRRITAMDGGWSDWFVATLVDFVVWGSRPTGYVDADTARWLTTSLGCGGGPTANAARAAGEIVREAELVDETLLIFVLRNGHGRSPAERREAAA